MSKHFGYGKKSGKKGSEPQIGKWNSLPHFQEAAVKNWPKSKRTRGAPKRNGGGRRAHFPPDPFAMPS